MVLITYSATLELYSFLPLSLSSVYRRVKERRLGTTQLGLKARLINVSGIVGALFIENTIEGTVLHSKVICNLSETKLLVNHARSTLPLILNARL